MPVPNDWVKMVTSCLEPDAEYETKFDCLYWGKLEGGRMPRT